jgi:hypothetical protein
MPALLRMEATMDVLNELLGGSQRPQYDDFVSRYDQGAPWDGIGDDEALGRYREVAPNLSNDQYRESAEEAFRRLTPEQRAEFGRWLQRQAREQHLGIPDLDRDGIDDRLQDPGFLAGATEQVRERQPNLLEGLLGGSSGGGLLSSPIAKAAIGGIAAMALTKLMRR